MKAARIIKPKPKEQINEAAKKAKDTFVRKWSTISIEERTGFLHDFAAQLRKR